MKEKLVCGRLVMVLVMLLVPTSAAFSQAIWTGEGGDNLWSNPDNWQDGFEATDADDALINGPSAFAPNGPLIEDGIDAVAKVLISDSGQATMTMTGGTLELVGWGSWWADAVGSTATFDMSGGEVNFTGGPGILELGWQDEGAAVGGSVGIWNMTGGVVNALGVDAPGKGNGGIAEINLHGGTLNVGTARGGLILYDGATIDITEGILVLEGDQPQVDDYIGDGWIVAYGGQSELVVDFDGDFTTVSAVRLIEEGVLQPGDANQDFQFNQLDLVQVQQAAKYLTGAAATWGEGDWNGAPAAGGVAGNPPAGNGLFDQLDIIAALNAGLYLTGPYVALAGTGSRNDAQTSIVYNPGTGEIAVDAPAGVELTSVNIDSASGIFTGAPAENLGGSFDNDADSNIFKATFGSSFASLSFGTVAQLDLAEDFLLNDLTVVGSLAGGGDLGLVDLVYVPEPSALMLLVMACLIGLLSRRVMMRR